MSQKAVESLLGRLLTDQAFRRRFYAEPAATCRAESLDVTGRELEAVLAVEEAHLIGFAGQLDPRIVRAGFDRDEGSNAEAKAATKGTAKLAAVK